MKIIAILIGLLATFNLCPNEKIEISSDSGNIEVSISGIKSKKGQIVVMLFNNKDGFPREVNKSYKTGIIKEFTSTATYIFRNIPYDTYAVVIFHDENRDGEIETNFIGIPKEPVGALNLSKRSKPSFNKCSFKFREMRKNLEIKFII